MKIEIKINGTEYEVTPKETTVSTNGESLAVIQDALYATKRFLTTECTELSEGIMQYLNEQDFVIVKSRKETTVSYNELLDDLLEAFQQACWIESEKKHDHLEISTWKRIQRTLIEAGKIKAEECYRQV